MNYIYDIYLNFNNTYFDFYDWDKQDNIIAVRKIPTFKVNSKTMNDIKNYHIKYDKAFIDQIRNKTEYFLGSTIKLLTSFLITDGMSVMAIKIDKKTQYSSLLIDEELDVIDEINFGETSFKYEKLNRINMNELKTRNQLKKEKLLKTKINKLFKEKNSSKIKYIYYECFNEKESNVEKIIQKLKTNLDNEKITSKLIVLFDKDTLAFN